MGVFHEMIHLINFAIQGAQMDIREDYGFEGERGFFHESSLRGIKKFISGD